MKTIKVICLAAVLLLAAVYGARKATDTPAQPASTEPGVTQVNPQAPDGTGASSSSEEPKAQPQKHAGPSVHGALRVEGTKLVDQTGMPVQLRGVSTHGLAWFPDYVNPACFQQLRQEWNADVVRLAMYTEEYGGYCSGGDQEALKALVERGVRLAAESDLYVIIDWHILSDGNPNQHREEARAFFRDMSARCAGMDHVIYEICNEPNGETTWQDIKSYALDMVGEIRRNDPEAVILVGTPNWSQAVDQAAVDPITEYDNLMYTLHFYAATHKEALRDRMRVVLDSGLPVFVSEYGICDTSGSGKVDIEQANIWADLLDQYGVSYVAWNLSNKNETSAILRPECSVTSGFSAEDLSLSGQWLYQRLTGTTPAAREEAADRPITSTQSPQGTAEPTAENLAASLTMVNTWESNGAVFRQYSLALKNDSDKSLDGWKVTIPFEEEFVVSDSWNGIFTVRNTDLEITSVDYNSTVPAGGTVSDIGFILRFL